MLQSNYKKLKSVPGTVLTCVLVIHWYKLGQYDLSLSLSHSSILSHLVYMLKQVSCGRVLSKPRPSLLLLRRVLGKTTKAKEEKERGEGDHDLTPWMLAKLIVSHPRCAQVFVFVCFQSHELFVHLMLSLFIACLYGATLLLCLAYQHLFARQIDRQSNEDRQWKRVSLIVHLSVWRVSAGQIWPAK